MSSCVVVDFDVDSSDRLPFCKNQGVEVKSKCIWSIGNASFEQKLRRAFHAFWRHPARHWHAGQQPADHRFAALESSVARLDSQRFDSFQSALSRSVLVNFDDYLNCYAVKPFPLLVSTQLFAFFGLRG